MTPMKKALLIVQGEGKGHLSQAVALKEYLEETEFTIVRVFAGNRPGSELPAYFRDAFPGILEQFRSPYLLRTPNQKGIDVGKSLLVNLFFSFRYLREVRRIRRAVRETGAGLVFNFYDIVGALALRKTGTGVRRIGIGHHFLVHLERYPCPGGKRWHRWLLRIHTSLILRSCDRVLALSYREVAGAQGIRVVPPLIRRKFRELNYEAGERFLVYFMAGGYLYDLVRIAREDPAFSADLFTGLVPDMDIPGGIRLHAFSEERFASLMSGCKGLISTAGFDLSAEAAYHGIPMLVIPARNHFEQLCNSLDVERSGIGKSVDHLLPGVQNHLMASDRNRFRAWVDRAGELLLNGIGEY
jgi:uncharacterized protein (TIGR00661 family)